MNNRPRLKIELTRTDKILEAIGWLMLLSIWIVTIVHYAELPNRIPTHYNSAGIIDGYGDKSFIWTLLLIVSALHIGLTTLSRFPHIFNYLTTITEENAERQYTIAITMIRYTKLGFNLIYGAIILQTIYSAMGRPNSFGAYITPLTFILILTAILYYIIASINK